MTYVQWLPLALLASWGCNRVCGVDHAEWHQPLQDDAESAPDSPSDASAEEEAPGERSSADVGTDAEDGDVADVSSNLDAAETRTCGPDGQPGTMTAFSLPTADNGATVVVGSLAVCNDGNLWFTELGGSPIGRITPDGTITPFSIPGGYGTPTTIARGPNGNCWFAERAPPGPALLPDRVGFITSSGGVTEFSFVPITSHLLRLASGSDANLWATVAPSGIARITPSGSSTLFDTDAGTLPVDIVGGADGNLWFTDFARRGAMGRVSTAGVITEFPLLAQDAGAVGLPSAIALGGDGNVWFTEANIDREPINIIGRVTPSGQIVEFPITQPAGAITGGPDGNVWFTETQANRLGRMTPSGAAREFAITVGDDTGGGPGAIAAGSACDLWFVESGSKLVHVPLL